MDYISEWKTWNKGGTLPIPSKIGKKKSKKSKKSKKRRK